MPIKATDLQPLGRDLHRPESVVITPDRQVVVSDWRGGVTVIERDGSQRTCLSQGHPLRPNGIAAAAGGGFLVAHLGDEDGGVYRLDQDGSSTPVLTAIGDVPLPPCNHVHRDALGRLWVSVSTRHHPRQRAWRPDVADGFVAVLDRRGARIVLDGLHYTNEVRVDPGGHWLYVVETFGRRVIRSAIGSDASLGPPEVVAAFAHGCWPDGFAFDTAAGIWVTSLVSNRVLRICRGTVTTVLEEVNAAFVDGVERAFARGEMTRAHLGPVPGTRLQQVTSIAFGGPTGTTALLGSLHGSVVETFEAGPFITP